MITKEQMKCKCKNEMICINVWRGVYWCYQCGICAVEHIHRVGIVWYIPKKEIHQQLLKLKKENEKLKMELKKQNIKFYNLDENIYYRNK